MTPEAGEPQHGGTAGGSVSAAEPGGIMGEIFNALEVLNRTMKLGLSGQELMRAEAGFKSALARQGNPDPTLDTVGLVENYELKVSFQKRAQPMKLGTLAALARREVSRPSIKADVKDLRLFDKALSAAPVVSPAALSKIVPKG